MTWEEHAASLRRIADDLEKLGTEAFRIYDETPCQCGGICQRCKRLDYLEELVSDACEVAAIETKLAFDVANRESHKEESGE